ncbi:unnamed protein product [Chondrus crispus]|uniref:phosphoribosylanthranilate isomerase n=1 Tax=Chondrus crispus TaxID=2769 RepID=R7Q9C6_CHOCR|nr:unnamed protein product [Chondrus crispus]CDF34659.1 unnamed protein product [Chondrus crispus]|eukprot:XP_005714478.1 unnamed protein product [Chondrus crispus]
MGALAKRPRCAPFFVHPSMALGQSPSANTLQTLKVCGVVSPEDASLVTAVTRSLLPPNVDLLIGSILWPGSKRSVSHATAAKIADVARAAGATPVAVFVDESIEEMRHVCKTCGFQISQLHGGPCRASVRSAGATLEEGLKFIDVKDIASDGRALEEEDIEGAFWRLYDAKGGGTGKPFNWSGFNRPQERWLLAGGLDPGNITQAITALRPNGVDVASGVAGEDRCKKDEKKLRLFVERLVEAYA